MLALKNILSVIIFTFLVVLFTAYTQLGIQGLMDAYHWISEVLTQVFSGGEVGNLIRQFIALLCMPLLIALIPSIIYWFTRRKWFPYFMTIFWVIWLIEVTAMALGHKATA